MCLRSTNVGSGERQGQGKIPRESNVHTETERWVKVRQKRDKYGVEENNISNLELWANMTFKVMQVQYGNEFKNNIFYMFQHAFP